MARDAEIRFRTVVSRVAHPPIGEAAFWVVQAMVVVMAGIHLFVDLQSSISGGSFPTGVPVDLLLIPVGYAALRYGLSGSAATALWAVLLWLPDLALPGGRGHPEDDVVELSLVVGFAVFAGIYVEREHLERARAAALEEEQRAAERRFAADLVHAQEEERRRIARELHDDPLQRLIQLARHLEDAGPEVGGSSALAGQPDARAGEPDARSGEPDARSGQPNARSGEPNARSGQPDARDELLDIVRSLRDLTRSLRPAGIDELGFVAALRGLLEDVEAAEGLHFVLDVTGEVVRLAPDAELSLLRIAQEAVSNAVRHAGASRLSVAVDFGGDSLSLTMADDGCGFDAGVESRPEAGHFGLLHMRERARLMGGSLDVRSSRGGGTVVAVTVPLAGADGAGADGAGADGAGALSAGVHGSAARGPARTGLAPKGRPPSPSEVRPASPAPGPVHLA